MIWTIDVNDIVHYPSLNQISEVVIRFLLSFLISLMQCEMTIVADIIKSSNISDIVNKLAPRNNPINPPSMPEKSRIK